MSLFGIPIFPEQASSFAMDVDALSFFVIAVSAFFSLLIAALVIGFGVRYHRRHAGEVGTRIEGNLPLELLWSVIPTVIAMVMFGWGASAYYHLRRPPGEAMHIYAVGKQQMACNTCHLIEHIRSMSPNATSVSAAGAPAAGGTSAPPATPPGSGR